MVKNHTYPISLVSAFSQILEKVAYNRASNFLKSKKKNTQMKNLDTQNFLQWKKN